MHRSPLTNCALNTPELPKSPGMYSVPGITISVHFDSIQRPVDAHQAGWHKGALDNMYLASSSRDVRLNHKGLWRACGLYVDWPCRVGGIFDNLRQEQPD